MKKLFTLIFATMAIFTSCSDDNKSGSQRYEVSVTTDANGSAVADPELALAGETVKLTATANEGFAFTSWSVEKGMVSLSDNTSNPATFTMPENDVKIKALFTALDYTVTVTATNGGKAIADPKGTVMGATVELRATPEKGYRFVKWTVTEGNATLKEAEAAETTFDMPAEDVTILAEFEAMTFAIATDQGVRNGKVKIEITGGGIDRAPVNAIITLTATPDEGFKFNGWTLEGFELKGDAIWRNPLTIGMPENDVTVKVDFLAQMDDVLSIITDPVFKAYAGFRMKNSQTILIGSEPENCPAWDTNGDGKLSEAEATAIRAIDISKEALEDLTGFTWDGTPVKSLAEVKHFAGLEVLNASSQAIPTLNLSMPFPALKTLICNNCGLSELYLTGCTGLETLLIQGNKFTELNLRNCKKLIELDCAHGNLTGLDISNNESLLKLSCYDNCISSLDIRAMAIQNDGYYLLRCGVQRIGEGGAIGVMSLKMRQNQVPYWNQVAAEEPELQYNKSISASL